MSDQIVILITAGSLEEGEHVAEALVAEKLAACVNLIPGITSIYRWEGTVQRDQECLLVVKSTGHVLEELVERVKAIHSYDVPEVIALPLVGGSEEYLRWIDGQVRSRR